MRKKSRGKKRGRPAGKRKYSVVVIDHRGHEHSETITDTKAKAKSAAKRALTRFKPRVKIYSSRVD